MTEARFDSERDRSSTPGLAHPTWSRCVCDQFGRCLTDCPSALLERPGPTWYWNRRLNKWVQR